MTKFKPFYIPANVLEQTNGGLVNIKKFEDVDERIFATSCNSKVVEFYHGSSIFITGGTGFIGQLLIEKLLRTCGGIDKIYLLIREKRGKTAEERLDKICANQIFDQLRKVRPKFKTKLVPLIGDVSMPCIGLSEEDIELIKKKVNIIFHAAATVNFDEKLSDAIKINVEGTRSVLKIAYECKNLRSLVYIGTAFSHCPRSDIDEKFYELPKNALEVLDSYQKGQVCNEQTKEILGIWPNTYTYTKAIAEYVVQNESKGLPICIMRPAIVVSTFREPLKGWTNNLYGPMGAIVGIGVGVIRTFMADCNKICDLVPADYVTNATICSAYYSSLTSTDDIKIYNYVSSTENPLNWGDFHDLVRHYGLQVPTVKAVWHISAKLHYNYYMHLFMTILVHLLPGMIVDAALMLTGRKPKMTSIYLKIQKLNNVLLFFSGAQWNFKNDNLKKMWNDMSDTDKKLFSFSMDPSNFSWNEEIHNMCLGIRKFLVKDDFSTLPEGIKRAKRLYYVDLFVKVIFFFLLFKFMLLPVLNIFYEYIFYKK